VPSNWKIDFENQNSNFRSQLFDMIRRADDDNMEKLRAGFPAEVAVYEAWMANLVGEFPAQVTI
jgi:hypothetical protein